MKEEMSAVMAIFLIASLASISMAVAEDVSDSSAADKTVNAVRATDVADNATATASGNETAAFAGVQGIWKLTLAGTDTIMALNQSGEYLFGLAKHEGDNPWNGAAAGVVSGNEISISLVAMQGEALAATYMSGTIEGDLIKGSYVRSDSKGNAARAEFDATRISPDTSDYTPATVEEARATATAQVETGQKQETEEARNTTVQTVAQTTQTKATSKFKDVTQLAKGINPDILPRMAPL
ncbi:Uncharacterised protein [uncultured archaeon]|nr:Uncharacterised protein [uncultured archaeon]